MGGRLGDPTLGDGWGKAYGGGGGGGGRGGAGEGAWGSRALVIDSIGSGQHALGEVYHFDLDDLYDPSAGHTTAVHDMSLMTALKMGRSMGADLPKQITVVAVESPYTYDFTEELTPPVAAAVPVAAQTVIDLLQNQSSTKDTKNHEGHS